MYIMHGIYILSILWSSKKLISLTMDNLALNMSNELESVKYV